ncbi:unnamed protein product, partial [Laminaria digitata]
IVNRALRKVVGLSANSRVSNVALWRETGVPPLAATTAGRRSRAYQKARKLNRWVRKLVDNPFKHRKQTWLSGTTRWMNANIHQLKKGGWKELGSKRTSAIVTKAVWAREERRLGTGATARLYTKAKYAKHPLTGAKHARWTELAPGLREIAKIRVGGARTAAWFARRGIIEAMYLDWCPCCGKEVTETWEHIMLRCPKWRKGRKEMLGTMIRAAHNL